MKVARTLIALLAIASVVSAAYLRTPTEPADAPAATPPASPSSSPAGLSPAPAEAAPDTPKEAVEEAHHATAMAKGQHVVDQATRELKEASAAHAAASKFVADALGNNKDKEAAKEKVEDKQAEVDKATTEAADSKAVFKATEAAYKKTEETAKAAAGDDKKKAPEAADTEAKKPDSKLEQKADSKKPDSAIGCTPGTDCGTPDEILDEISKKPDEVLDEVLGDPNAHKMDTKKPEAEAADAKKADSAQAEAADAKKAESAGAPAAAFISEGIGARGGPKGPGQPELTKEAACNECAKYKPFLESPEQGGEDCFCHATDIMNTFQNDATKKLKTRLKYGDQTQQTGAPGLSQGWMWHCHPVTGTEGVWTECPSGASGTSGTSGTSGVFE